MSKRRARRIGAAMLAGAAAFVLYALNNPQAGFPWQNGVTYLLYGIYLAGAAVLLLAPFGGKK